MTLTRGSLTRVDLKPRWESNPFDERKFVFQFNTDPEKFYPKEGSTCGRLVESDAVMVVQVLPRWVYVLTKHGPGWVYAETLRGAEENAEHHRL